MSKTSDKKFEMLVRLGNGLYLPRTRYPTPHRAKVVSHTPNGPIKAVFCSLTLLKLYGAYKFYTPSQFTLMSISIFCMNHVDLLSYSVSLW